MGSKCLMQGGEWRLWARQSQQEASRSSIASRHSIPAISPPVALAAAARQAIAILLPSTAARRLSRKGFVSRDPVLLLLPRGCAVAAGREEAKGISGSWQCPGSVVSEPETGGREGRTYMTTTLNFFVVYSRRVSAGSQVSCLVALAERGPAARSVERALRLLPTSRRRAATARSLPAGSRGEVSERREED